MVFLQVPIGKMMENWSFYMLRNGKYFIGI